jgi:hypothetical protein
MQTREVIVEITEQDIKLGCVGHGRNCPIARAITRLLTPKAVVFVDYFEILFFDDHENLNERKSVPVFSVTPPKEAYDFMTGFDGGALSEPFAFQLSIPERMLA